MDDENKEMINTEEPIEVSDELLKELMEASAEIDRGEVYSNAEVMDYLDAMEKRVIDHKRQEALLKVGS